MYMYVTLYIENKELLDKPSLAHCNLVLSTCVLFVYTCTPNMMIQVHVHVSITIPEAIDFLSTSNSDLLY